MHRALALCLALTSLAASAEEGRSALGEPPRGVFTGESWRYRRAHLVEGLLTRIAADVVAIPSGLPWWGGPEWLLAGAVVGSTLGLSVGRPSLDVQFQALVQSGFLPPGHFTVWNMTGDLVIWGLAAAGVAGLLVGGLIAHHDRATETAVLMIEAFVVTQAYHNLIKLLVGRAGPERPALEGGYFGPAAGYRFWPSGTPSGHMATMYALLVVLMESVDHPALWAGLNAFAVVFGAALVGDGYHWLSDVLLGAAIGAGVGRWVVRHRSSWYVYGERGAASPVAVLPLVVPSMGAAGLAVGGTF
jgi:membrane-associated phospholipid phosphatase